MKDRKHEMLLKKECHVDGIELVHILSPVRDCENAGEYINSHLQTHARSEVL